MKRYCLFDSKHSWDHEACVSDLLPSSEAWGLFSSLPTWGAQVSCIFSNPLQNPGLCLFWGLEDIVQRPEKKRRGRDGKDLQNSHCWSKPDFEHKTNRSAEMAGTFFFLLAFYFPPFLSLFPSSSPFFCNQIKFSFFFILNKTKQFRISGSA